MSTITWPDKVGTSDKGGKRTKIAVEVLRYVIHSEKMAIEAAILVKLKRRHTTVLPSEIAKDPKSHVVISQQQREKTPDRK